MIHNLENDLIPEEILGASRHDEQLVFLIKFKDVAEGKLIWGKEANEKIPQMVISFYEKHLRFLKDEQEESDGEH